MVFELSDRLWTLPDGLLDPLDKYENPKKMAKIKFLDSFFILDPWPAIFDHLDLEIGAGNLLELKILTSASHCLNMVFIRALGCRFMPKQGSIIGRSVSYTHLTLPTILRV